MRRQVVRENTRGDSREWLHHGAVPVLNAANPVAGVDRVREDPPPPHGCMCHTSGSARSILATHRLLTCTA